MCGYVCIHKEKAPIANIYKVCLDRIYWGGGGILYLQQKEWSHKSENNEDKGVDDAERRRPI